MRSRRTLALLAITLIALFARSRDATAQSATAAGGVAVDHRETGASLTPSQTSTTAPAAQVPSDQTLEIAPRLPTSPPAVETPPEPAADANLNNDAMPADDGTTAAPPTPCRPYLGIGVQTIYSNDRPGGLVTGLEVVSVDRNSPAATAGLRGRGKMTSVGESGATVGGLMPPLNLFVMPLLKKTGSLGEGGDLIVAIDDRRVANDLDLQSELEALKPGDTIYLTIVRPTKDGPQQTLKVPIKLGDASKAVAKADDDGDQPPPSSSAGSPAKQP